MISRQLRGATALLLGLVMVGAVAPTARAATFRHTDATGDVRLSTSADGQTYRDAGVVRSVRRGDLTGLTVQHTLEVVRVSSGLRAPAQQWLARIVTSTGNTYDVVRATDGTNAVVSFRRNGKAATCEGLSVVPTRSGIVATVPRRCVGTPYRIKVGVQAGGELDRTAGRTRFGTDDALLVGTGRAFRPRLSGWIVGSA